MLDIMVLMKIAGRCFSLAVFLKQYIVVLAPMIAAVVNVVGRWIRTFGDLLPLVIIALMYKGE
jgi:hypothetical protein